MIKEINFLRERRKDLTKQEKKDRRMLMMASVFFGIVFIAFLILFGIRLFLGRQLFNLVSTQKTVRGEITANEQTERSFVVFVNKLSALSTIYQGKQDKKAVIDYFDQLFGSRVLIRKIEFDQKEKLLVFRIQSKDIFTLKEILAEVNSEDVRSKFATLSTSDLRREEDGRYELTVTVLAAQNKL